VLHQIVGHHVTRFCQVILVLLQQLPKICRHFLLLTRPLHKGQPPTYFLHLLTSKSIKETNRVCKRRIAHIFGPVSVQTAQKVRKNGPFSENLFLFQIFRPKSLFIYFSDFVPFCNFFNEQFSLFFCVFSDIPQSCTTCTVAK
jgi:hypothetical protein